MDMSSGVRSMADMVLSDVVRIRPQRNIGWSVEFNLVCASMASGLFDLVPSSRSGWNNDWPGMTDTIFNVSSVSSRRLCDP